MIVNPEATPGVNKKLIARYKGPYKIHKTLPNDRYVVVDPDGYQFSQRPFESIVAVDCIKPWCNNDD